MWNYLGGIVWAWSRRPDWSTVASAGTRTSSNFIPNWISEGILTISSFISAEQVSRIYDARSRRIGGWWTPLRSISAISWTWASLALCPSAWIANWVNTKIINRSCVEISFSKDLVTYEVLSVRTPIRCSACWWSITVASNRYWSWSCRSWDYKLGNFA